MSIIALLKIMHSILVKQISAVDWFHVDFQTWFSKINLFHIIKADLLKIKKSHDLSWWSLFLSVLPIDLVLWVCAPSYILDYKDWLQWGTISHFFIYLTPFCLQIFSHMFGNFTRTLKIFFSENKFTLFLISITIENFNNVQQYSIML